MGRRIPQEKKFISNLEIVDIAEEGKGVAKHDSMVLFVERGVPGDVVDVELMRKKKSFYEARVTKVNRPSAHRTEAFCAHFGVCGGCKWQHMEYAAQLTFKQQYVENVLRRSEEHTSELQSRENLVCRLLLEKKNNIMQ